MSGWLITSLQIMTGFLVLVGIQHISISLYEGRDRMHGLFSFVALASASFALFRILGHSSETAESLVVYRQGEILSIGLFCIFLLWFTAEYTAFKRRNLLILLSAGWVLLITVNLMRPHGLIYSDLPVLPSLRSASGSHLLDLSFPASNPLNIVLRTYLLVSLAYCGYASLRIKSLGNSFRSQVLFSATVLMAAFCGLDLLVDLQLFDFTIASNFSFLPFAALVSLGLLKEANNERQNMISILDFLPVGIAINDSNGTPVFSNNTFKHYFEDSPREFEQPLGATTAVPSEDIATIQSQIMKENPHSRTELKLPINGKASIFEVAHVPISMDKTAPCDTVFIFNDISKRLRKKREIERLRKQAALLRKQVESDVFVKSLAHEIRQPLAAILNNAQAGLNFMENKDFNIDEIKEILVDIVRDEKRAGDIINSLRAMLGKKRVKFEILELSKILNDVVKLLNRDFLLNEVTVNIEEEKEIFVRANKTQLQQVLVNIIENAFEAMGETEPDLRQLKLKMFQRRNQAVISISDTGKGIRSDKLSQIFEGFYTTKAQGMGVGLEVCRAIMESHGGKIWAQNGDDRGTEFYVSLPISSPSPDSKQ